MEGKINKMTLMMDNANYHKEFDTPKANFLHKQIVNTYLVKCNVLYYTAEDQDIDEVTYWKEYQNVYIKEDDLHNLLSNTRYAQEQEGSIIHVIKTEDTSKAEFILALNTDPNMVKTAEDGVETPAYKQALNNVQAKILKTSCIGRIDILEKLATHPAEPDMLLPVTALVYTADSQDIDQYWKKFSYKIFPSSLETILDQQAEVNDYSSNFTQFYIDQDKAPMTSLKITKGKALATDEPVVSSIVRNDYIQEIELD